MLVPKAPTRLTLVAALVAAGIGRVDGASAAELVMFDSPVCEWCEVWEDEVGIVYNKTEEACLAPIRRVSVFDEVPDDLKTVRSVVYTPTFVLVDGGKELGRILGYPGESHFWGLLGQMLKRIEKPSSVCERPGNTADIPVEGSDRS